MQAEVISIGDELLAGLTINSNASFIAENLLGIGIPVRWITTVGDNEDDILGAMEKAHDRAEVIIMTGGLGPTNDDISRHVVARFLDAKLILRKDVLDQIARRFKRMNRTMAPTNEIQAQIPDKADIIENRIGTAPGLQFKKDNRLFFVLPGVPSEMKRMIMKSVLPILENRAGENILCGVKLKTTGVAESELYYQIRKFTDLFPKIRLAFLPNPSGIVIRLTAREQSATDCTNLLDKGKHYIYQQVGQYIYGEDDHTLEQTVGTLLLKAGKTIAVAESCTGGLISDKLTNISGSSAYFERGVIAYSNRAKIDILNVRSDIIKKYGAVSEETAEAMARGIKKISGADIGLSTTGIAGPTGATPDKPVGFVCIGYSDDQRTFVQKYVFTRDRLWNKERFAMSALDIVRKTILGDI